MNPKLIKDVFTWMGVTVFLSVEKY